MIFAPLPPEKLFAQHAKRCTQATRECFHWLIQARGLRERENVDYILERLIKSGAFQRSGGYYELTPQGWIGAMTGCREPMEWELAVFAKSILEDKRKSPHERTGGRLLLGLADRLAEEYWTCGEWDVDAYSWSRNALRKDAGYIKKLNICEINRVIVYMGRAARHSGGGGGYSSELWDRGVVPAIGERLAELLSSGPCPTLRHFFL